MEHFSMQLASQHLHAAYRLLLPLVMILWGLPSCLASRDIEHAAPNQFKREINIERMGIFMAATKGLQKPKDSECRVLCSNLLPL